MDNDNFEIDYVNYLKVTLKYNFKQIYENLNINKKRFYRWRKMVNYQDPLLQINDEEVELFAFDVFQDNPERGQIFFDGYLRALDIKIPRDRLRDCVHRVDPGGNSTRLRKSIKRRIYNITRPNNLWHIDGYNIIHIYFL